MDQTCSIMAQPDHGLLIRFRPRLTTLPVKLPVNAAFVIFNSLATSQKAVSAEYRFNLRVVETQLAAYVLGYRLGIVSDLNISLNGTSKRYTWSLYDVARVWLEKKTGIAGQLACEQADALDSMLDVVKDILTLPSYTLDDVAAMTGNTTRQLHQKFLSRFPVRTDVFKLRERALHVYSEAARVCRFYTLCEEASASSSTTGYLKTLGQLMQESQRSCRELYECSCPELDILTKLCLQHGAYGARLTGAGWGGCCVALVDQVYAKTFVQRVAADYYQNYMGLSHLDISQLAFSCFAGRGAYLITF
jgi:galactokinase